MTRIEIVKGDIVAQDTDAIVNAANESLLPGGGVCGAIHRAAGPRLAEECKRKRPQGISTGSALSTWGFDLGRHVIHAVGPKWDLGPRKTWWLGEYQDCEEYTYLLTTAYANAVLHADLMGLRSVAFPSIGTGIFGWPVSEAAPIALRAVRSACEWTGIALVRFVLFDDATLRAYEEAAA